MLRSLSLKSYLLMTAGVIKTGLGHFPSGFPPKKNANSVVEIEGRLMKQYLLSRSWMKQIFVN